MGYDCFCKYNRHAELGVAIFYKEEKFIIDREKSGFGIYDDLVDPEGESSAKPILNNKKFASDDFVKPYVNKP